MIYQTICNFISIHNNQVPKYSHPIMTVIYLLTAAIQHPKLYPVTGTKYSDVSVCDAIPYWNQSRCIHQVDLLATWAPSYSFHCMQILVLFEWFSEKRGLHLSYYNTNSEFRLLPSYQLSCTNIKAFPKKKSLKDVLKTIFCFRTYLFSYYLRFGI